MKRHAIVIALGAFSIVACRAVVGIEDLTVDADASTGDGAVAFDSGVDPKTCKDAPDCRACCTTAIPTADLQQLALFAKGKNCVCPTLAGTCGTLTQCGGANDLCGNASKVTPACGSCVEDEVTKKSPSANCVLAITQCDGQKSCKAALDCVQSCSK